jgi:hypothetical protein
MAGAPVALERFFGRAEKCLEPRAALEVAARPTAQLELEIGDDLDYYPLVVLAFGKDFLMTKLLIAPLNPLG